MGASLKVTVSPQGVEATQAALAQLSQAVAASSATATRSMSTAVMGHIDGMDRRFATAALRMTESASRVAASGDLMGNGMSRVLAVGGEMAFMFGTTGPIVGALAVAALAVARIFTTARDEIDKTVQKIEEMQYAGNAVGGVGVLRELYLGAPGQKSLAELRADTTLAKAAPLRQLVPALGPVFDFFAQRALTARERTLEQATKQVLDPRTPPPALGLPAVKITAGGKEAYGGPVTEQFTSMELARFIAKQWADTGMPEWQKKLDAGDGSAKMVEGVGKDLVESMARSVEASFEGESGKKFGIALEGGVKEITGKMKWTTIRAELGAGLAGAVSGGLVAGLQTALASGDIRQAFGAMGQFILGQLSQLMVNVALKAIAFAELMGQFETYLLANPWAAVGIGVAMLALAHSFQSSGVTGGAAPGGGYGPRGYGGAAASAEATRVLWGADSATVAAGLTPRSATQVVVIGVDDPTAQRKILELIRKGERRG